MRSTYHTGDDTLDPVVGEISDNCEYRHVQEFETDIRQTLFLVTKWAALSAGVVIGCRLFGSWFPILTVFVICRRYAAPTYEPDTGERLQWSRLFVSVSVIGLWLLFLSVPLDLKQTGRWLGSLRYLHPLFIIATTSLAAGLLWKRNRLDRLVAPVLFTGPAACVVLLLFRIDMTGLVVISVIGATSLVAAMKVGEAIALVYVESLSCNPRLTEQDRSRLRESVSSGVSPHQGCTRALIAWLFSGHGIVVVLILTFRRQFAVSSVAASIAVVAVLCILLVVVAQVVGTRLPPNVTRRRLTEHIERAVSLWLCLNPHPNAAAVYRPREPWDDIRCRRIAFTLCVFLTVSAVVPVCGAFPLALLSPSPWSEVVYDSTPGLGDWVIAASHYAVEIFFTASGDALPEATGEPAAPLDGIRRQGLSEYLNDHPEGWMAIAIVGSGQAKPFFVATILISAVLSVFVPLLFMLSTVILAAHRHIRWAASIVSDTDTTAIAWEGAVQTAQQSEDETERNSLLVGFHAATDIPILVHRSMLREHGHFLGDTGSGKTAMAIAPYSAQLIRMAGRDKGVEDRTQSSIVIIDNKGDPALFHGTRIEAERAGLPFRWFTNQTECSTHVFNPFLQSHISSLTVTQKGQLFSSALALSYGEGYGREFFSVQNERALTRLLEAFPDIRSFRELANYATSAKADLLGKQLRFDRKDQEDAKALFTILEQMALLEALNATPGTDYPDVVFDDQIDLASVYDTPQVVYFYIRAALEPSTARRIGKLAFHCLHTAAAVRRPGCQESNQVYLFVDEFQRLASQDLDTVLQQARSQNLAVILAHQSVQDLVLPDADIRSVVQTNTRFRQYFAASDPEQQKVLVESSGETIDFVNSWSESESMGPAGGSFSAGANAYELAAPRITANDIIRMADAPEQSVVQLPRGAGYARFRGFPFIARGLYHITQEEYSSRQSLPWPDGVPGTITHNSNRQKPVPASESPEPAPVVSEPSKCSEKLNELGRLANERRQRRESFTRPPKRRRRGK